MPTIMVLSARGPHHDCNPPTLKQLIAGVALGSAQGKSQWPGPVAPRHRPRLGYGLARWLVWIRRLQRRSLRLPPRRHPRVVCTLLYISPSLDSNINRQLEPKWDPWKQTLASEARRQRGLPRKMLESLKARVEVPAVSTIWPDGGCTPSH